MAQVPQIKMAVEDGFSYKPVILKYGFSGFIHPIPCKYAQRIFNKETNKMPFSTFLHLIKPRLIAKAITCANNNEPIKYNTL